MTIRPAKIKELDQIIALNALIFKDLNPQFDSDYNPKYYSQTPEGINYFRKAINNKSGQFLVAEINQKLVGFINAAPTEEFNFRHGKYLLIYDLGIHPEHAGKGIGKKLMSSVLEWAKKNNYTKVDLFCYSQNSRALHFYRSLGFDQMFVTLEKAI
jgi:ribosomal protein S18 acetylase RimI-like enzyme